MEKAPPAAADDAEEANEEPHPRLWRVGLAKREGSGSGGGKGCRGDAGRRALGAEHAQRPPAAQPRLALSVRERRQLASKLEREVSKLQRVLTMCAPA